MGYGICVYDGSKDIVPLFMLNLHVVGKLGVVVIFQSVTNNLYHLDRSKTGVSLHLKYLIDDPLSGEVELCIPSSYNSICAVQHGVHSYPVSIRSHHHHQHRVMFLCLPVHP